MNERQEHVFVVCAIVDARSGVVGANLPVQSTRSGGQSSPNTHLPEDAARSSRVSANLYDLD
ncbi:hypothetical protein TMEN_10030 [Trichophyton mentagrophytes]|nr:hypothetical protein TMEN_10030 [Trichophyton mentagrophytes]